MAREGDLGVLSFRTMEERELKPRPSLGEEGAIYTPSQNVAVAASLGPETLVPNFLQRLQLVWGYK